MGNLSKQTERVVLVAIYLGLCILVAAAFVRVLKPYSVAEGMLGLAFGVLAAWGVWVVSKRFS